MPRRRAARSRRCSRPSSPASACAPTCSDTLVVAITQSGTTTDTNRTVDLARARGAAVIAIVNRRQSDLVDKSDGVLYTSDGRDVEMSVASTKAFYSQIAAGFLLAPRIADELGAGDDRGAAATQELLAALRELPDAMSEVVAAGPRSRRPRSATRPHRRSWAVVGNGVNRVAAHELRIKLSELCYKSIACDVTEDKKHIDLSSEPMILVCAAGLQRLERRRRRQGARDLPRAQGRADRDRRRRRDALRLPRSRRSRCPRCTRRSRSCVAAMAGHLFGYEAALAIDASARPLREARALIETLVGRRLDPDDLLVDARPGLEPLAARFFDGLRAGNYDGSLEAGTAVRLASLLRYATGVVPLDAYPGRVRQGRHAEHASSRTSPPRSRRRSRSSRARSTRSSTRPRRSPSASRAPTRRCSRCRSCRRCSRRARRATASRTARCARWSPSTPRSTRCIGWTRYRIEGDGPATTTDDPRRRPRRHRARHPVAHRHDPALRGTKHRVATEREVTVARGSLRRAHADLIVPEVKGNQTTGLTLLHVRFHDRLPAEAARQVLEGYRDRYQAIADQVTETEPIIRDDVLGRSTCRAAHRAGRPRSPITGEAEARGAMRRVVTPAEMAEADRATIAAGTPEAVLVERAGTAVASARAAHARRHVRPPGRVVCGKGNNGADGRVAARVLRGWGVGVDELELADGIDRAAASRALARADLVRSTRCTAPASAARSTATPRGSPSRRSVGASGARGRHPVGRRRAHRRGARRRPCAPTQRSASRAQKPGLLFEPGRRTPGASRSSTSASRSERFGTRRRRAGRALRRRRVTPRALDERRRAQVVVGPCSSSAARPA